MDRHRVVESLSRKQTRHHEVFFDPEQVVYASGAWAATTILDPEADTVTVRFIDSETADVAHESVLSQNV